MIFELLEIGICVSGLYGGARASKDIQHHVRAKIEHKKKKEEAPKKELIKGVPTPGDIFVGMVCQAMLQQLPAKIQSPYNGRDRNYSSSRTIRVGTKNVVYTVHSSYGSSYVKRVLSVDGVEAPDLSAWAEEELANTSAKVDGLLREKQLAEKKAKDEQIFVDLIEQVFSTPKESEGKDNEEHSQNVGDIRDLTHGVVWGDGLQPSAPVLSST